MSQLTDVSSHNAKRLAPFDYIKITILGFGLAALWGSLHDIVLPLRLLDFISESQKNTYLGFLAFTGLILAIVVQPIAGALSDRSRSKWGRRRPFIGLGITLVILFLPGIRLAPSFAFLFATYCLLQISSNTAEGPFHALIPDLVPERSRGEASGVKSILEVLGGLAVVRLIAYLMERYVAGEGGARLWLVLGALAAVLLGVMTFTVLTVKEQPGTGAVRAPVLSTLYKSFNINVKANRDFVLFLVARGLMGMPGAMLSIFALYYLMDVVGLANPVAAAANLLVIIGICLLAVVYPAGRLSDIVGRKSIVVSSGLLGTLGILSLFFSKSYTHILLSAALLGIAYGGFMSSSWALATDLVAKGEEARYLGLANIASAGGSALAYLVGPAIDFFNSIRPHLGYQVMLLVCFVCFIAGSLLLLKIKHR
jgi:Na+/melibiose symporter-like transporter